MFRVRALHLTGLLSLALVGWGGTTATAQPKEVPARFQNLPAGWTVKESMSYPEVKIAGQAVRLSNTTLVFGGRELKVNIAECPTDDAATKIHDIFLRAQKGNHTRAPREGRTVIEFVCNDKDVKLVERAYAELGFKPLKVTYEVSFKAAPFEKCDYTHWNAMYNAFLATKPDEARVRQLAKSFTFNDQIRLRNHGLGGEKSVVTFTPRPRETKDEANGDITLYSFANLPNKFGVPEVSVALTVTVEAFAITPTKRKAGKELLEATEFWPSNDPDLVALAKKITEGKTTVRDKTTAILDWFASRKDITPSAKVPGFRYGVKKTLQQRCGMCWDFSDIFVTLCRASGVPCRQVLGWYYGLEGHVWAEVLLEGEGWWQVDPIAGMGSDSRYIPYIANEEGKMPFAYLSAVNIQLKR